MGLLDFIARTGRGLGAAGRDVAGQMFGSTGPNDPSTLGGRFGNIIANEANPLGILQTGQAFAEGFRGQSGTAPDRFAATTESISQAASRTRPPGSVVARGFVGRQDRGPVTAGAGGVRGDGRFAGGGLLGNTFGQSQPTGSYRMPVDEYRATIPELVRRDGGSAERGSSRIGAGQLGRGGDEALNAASRAMFSRRGTQAEQ